MMLALGVGGEQAIELISNFQRLYSFLRSCFAVSWVAK